MRDSLRCLRNEKLYAKGDNSTQHFVAGEHVPAATAADGDLSTLRLQ